MTEEETAPEENSKEAATTLSAGELERESLQKQIDELAEYKEKYLRLLAEQENARKRLHKERQENTEFAIRGLILELLTPIDHFERALHFSEQMSDEIKHWGQGFQMILTQMRDALQSHGVTPMITKTGDTFDPHLHEAIESIQTDQYPNETIVEEITRGYKIGDKILRPARVTVAKELKVSKEEEEKNHG